MGKGEEDAPQRMAKGVQLSCGNGGGPVSKDEGGRRPGPKGRSMFCAEGGAKMSAASLPSKEGVLRQRGEGCLAVKWVLR